jgi:hypothetical protein
MNNKRISLFEEYSNSQLSKVLDTFNLKDSLNPKVWDENEKMNPKIREILLEIANDVFADLELPFTYDDVTLTGSLANYNWSIYSDFDLHIIIDYANINDDEELTEKYLDLFKFKWLAKHDIKLYGYEVEIYIQDKDKKHFSTGIYSILNDEWEIKPSKENFPSKMDLKGIEEKAKMYIDAIDKTVDNLNKNNLEESHDEIKKIWKKIKKGRESGLAEEGEMSLENLVFKLLRRSGYIEKALDTMNRIYDLEKEKGFE